MQAGGRNATLEAIYRKHFAASAPLMDVLARVRERKREGGTAWCDPMLSVHLHGRVHVLYFPGEDLLQTQVRTLPLPPR